ncbi:RagB/SusD family protein [Chryseobacterium sp. StRB126]|uniref:RagB/SusD family nutrient uptake outer membrane protein n=1 Tax=Chryseobacterium sp. StRB126 TaxID=878220 RepID=UPI0004E990F0|nr:RagB/SusD family nutrient uptake outer membrane protein [Chryseobacterium sp. StRB126]BAP29211.1 RagB/SusD family protein [Chryseobacterium sp. StRB126]
MKNYKLKIALLASTVFFASCSNDFLDEKPTTTLPLETAITSELTLKTAVNGLYNMMQNTGDLSLNSSLVTQSSYGGLILTFNELLADNGFVGLKNSNRFSTTRSKDLSFYVATNGDVANLWNSLYRIISNANLVIEKDGQIGDDLNTSIKPENYFAQAYTVRALAYLQLASLYCDNYGETNQELGLPLVDKFDIQVKKSRSTVKQTYDFILADLKKAEKSILTVYPDSPAGENSKRLTLNALNMIYARYYLAVKDYPNAQLYAEKVLPNFKGLSIDKVKDYFSVSSEGELDETIFQLDNNSKDLPSSNDGLLATWSSAGTYKQNFATRAFYNKLGSDDVRKDTWYQNNTFVQTLGDNPKPIDVLKYTSFERDIVVFRRSEAVFIRLEALYHTNPALALTELNTWVKTNRAPSYAYAGAGSALLDEILFQKNAELFLEGTRRTDLKRNNIGFTNSQTQVAITSDKKQFRFLPIPQSELNNNPNMVQNPGY